MKNKYHRIMQRFYNALYELTFKLKDYFCTKSILHFLAIEDDSEV